MRSHGDDKHHNLQDPVVRPYVDGILYIEEQIFLASSGMTYQVYTFTSNWLLHELVGLHIRGQVNYLINSCERAYVSLNAKITPMTSVFLVVSILGNNPLRL